MIKYNSASESSYFIIFYHFLCGEAKRNVHFDKTHHFRLLFKVTEPKYHYSVMLSILIH